MVQIALNAEQSRRVREGEGVAFRFADGVERVGFVAAGRPSEGEAVPREVLEELAAMRPGDEGPALTTAEVLARMEALRPSK